MLVKELIEILSKYNPNANICVEGNGKGASPFIDLDHHDFYEVEDCEWGDRDTVPSPTLQCGCNDHIDDKGWECQDPEKHLRKVVVLFSSEGIY